MDQSYFHNWTHVLWRGYELAKKSWTLYWVLFGAVHMLINKEIDSTSLKKNIDKYSS